MFASDQKLIDKKLRQLLPKDNSRLSRAMRYSIFAGGKRIRPILCLEAARAVRGIVEPALTAACAIEMIHTFTLIHDDLPAMDNSDLRRGKPACHKAFGEDIAILAGDALNTLAFKVLSKHSPKAANLSAELAQALLKVVKGQVMDLESEGKRISPAKLKKLHLNKTAALIEAAVRMGAISVNAKDAEIKSLTDYARYLGLAFQVVDDILDVTSNAAVLGKPAQADKKSQKSTYPAVMGLKKAKQRAKEYADRSLKALNYFGKRADPLREIANLILRRKR